MHAATIKIVGSANTNSARETLSGLLRELGYTVGDSDEANGFIFLASQKDDPDETRMLADSIWSCTEPRYLLQIEVIAALALIPLRELLREFVSPISSSERVATVTG